MCDSSSLRLPWKSGNTDICAESKYITHMFRVSLSLSHSHNWLIADAQDTSEHISARLCPYFSLFDPTRTHRTRASTPCSLVSCESLSRFLWTPRTQASTLVLACVLISLFSTPHGHTGHKRACQCSPMSFMSVTLSLHRQDTQDMSEHTGAHLCLVSY